jgi:hypothetical protein
MPHIPYLFLLFWCDICACFFEQRKLLHVDIVDTVTLISSTVLCCSRVEVSASVSVKNPTSHKENVGKWYMDPNNPVDNHHLSLLSWLLSYHLVCFGYQIKWCSWKLNRLQLFHATLKTIWNFYYSVFKSSSLTSSNVLSAPNKHTVGSISFVSSEVSCNHKFDLPEIPQIMSLLQCIFSFLPCIYCSLHLNEWKCLIGISQDIWMLVLLLY